MKLVVPDISIPATGEKTLRQYKCANISSPTSGMNTDLTIAVTNRRIIQHAESSNSAKSELLHNEIFIDNIGGISFSRGDKSEKKGMGLKLFLFFILFAGLGGVAYWQSAPIFDFVKRSISTITYNDVFRFVLAGIPLLIYIIIAIIMNIKAKKYVLNMVIYTKGLKSFDLITTSHETEESSGYIVIPHLKETKTMISEIASIILDVQRFGPVDVLKYIDAEESAI